jgi:hypothetical protein
MFPEVRTMFDARSNVTLLRRHVCHWGLFGHVKASLEGLVWFLNGDCDYAILLTGQCYPLRSEEQITRELDDLQGRSLIESSRFPKVEWDSENGGYTRIERFYFRYGRRLKPRSIRLWTRKVPMGMHPYGGSSYWCISRDCVEYILRFLQRFPSYNRFFESTYVPDEMFFQTIVGNSEFGDFLVNSKMHFVDWPDEQAHAGIMREQTVRDALESGYWFARKFEDVSMIDLVDELRAATASKVQVAPWRSQLARTETMN